ncbi:Protein transport protein sec72 [Sphaceloma murrayae]|uniref:Protein transport protein sec72 n=1 Tax=Sphaceloma murrayae TaxID=2082308 RepID=A0A2K1QQ07_9PEZI|nr:Protein transport protein sec72 [Sphaceloma murrayae]
MADPEGAPNAPNHEPTTLSTQAVDRNDPPSPIGEDEKHAATNASSNGETDIHVAERHTAAAGNEPDQEEAPRVGDTSMEDTTAQAVDQAHTPISRTPISTGSGTPNGEKRPSPAREESTQSIDTPVRSSRATSFSQNLDSGRRRTDSSSTAATSATARSTPRTSMVFVQTALETIANSKDARKKKPLGDAAQKALSLIKGQGDLTQTNPEVIFLPLQLATEASTIPIVTTALDCIGKLISYSYFAVSGESQGDAQKSPLIERAIDTICDCFQGEATPNEVQMQIIKSLLSAILNDKIVVHGAGLLKSVRQIYNIFLLSKSSPNQQIAQGTLTQMVGTVFERVKVRLSSRAARFNSSKSLLKSGPYTDSTLSPDTPLTAHPDSQESPESDGEGESEVGDEVSRTDDGEHEDVEDTKMTLQTFETRKSFDDARIADNAPTMVTRVRRHRANTRSISGPDIPAITIQGEGEDGNEDDEEDEIYIKDAFLVFRAMCKLSTKALTVEDTVDIRSQGMRSKLLSLHIIHNVLHNHPIIFTSPYATIRSSNNNEPTSFTQAVKQYLCLSLSRNGSSSNNRVFEVSCEIFSLMVQHLRVVLKREIEVFLKEIYLAVLEKRSAPPFQKQYIIYTFTRLVKDAKALVEIYLNYDCDRAALDNMYQRIIEHISRLASSPVTASAEQEHQYFDTLKQHRGGPSDWQNKAVLPQSLSSATITASSDLDRGIPTDYILKQESLECLVESLRSMVAWSQQGLEYTAASLTNGSRNSTDEMRESIDNRDNVTSASSPLPLSAESGPPVSPATPIAEDDPTELERVKQHKTALNNAVRQFNFKPKRGIKALIQGGFIASEAPGDIASFMLTNEKINKKALGEYLGEGDAENIAIMHAFVDQMDFTKSRFVDALRRFLQTFRLPGEAQKIDRLMLKFAERYTNGNPNAFANADTAYVLAYSVIMLNTDQHSSNVKKRMTPEDFIKNNRGINDNQDLPDEYLKGIFEEIASNEIVLDTERETAANLGMLPQPTAGFAAGIGQALATVGRDLQREAYNQASEEMANKTEALFKNLLRAQKKGGTSKSLNARFIPAQSFRHVGPMFEVTWMSYLTALSGQVQETNNLEAIKLCMEGLKLAVRIACLFDLSDPRQAFISSLTRFTNLYNLSEMKVKNIEALKTLLDTAYSEGNLLRESWRDVLTAISQLDRFQLISGGVRENEVPDVMRRQGQPPPVRRGQATRKPGRTESGFQADVAEESRSADMIRSVDRIFTNTANLSGDAIVHFVRALTQVSWQEIQSSGQSESPRTYSLQKIVEVSGYNMTRVRFEWTNIWQVLGDHFVQVGCHNNTSVVYFALNSLRQLSMKFMEIEELPGFKFQKDFLKPFEHILSNANQVPVKDIVLRCLIQMIQARGDNIRSGWRTMFGVFTVAAKEPYEAIVNLAFDNVTQVYNDRFGIVISQGAFADLVVCLTEFSKNEKFQKKSLQAIETLKATVPKMLRTPECPLSQKIDTMREQSVADGVPKQPTRQTQEEQFWFPVLFAFHDVLMTGEDLEVRSRALNYLFDTLTRYGRDFPRDFWDILWRQLLYPIFMVLKSKSEMSKALNHEELSVWLSTTMIQALRNMISLFTHFFDSLEYMLDRFLDLLALCICQENDTLARIGSNCLQQLILQNVTRFTAAHWDQIVGSFVELFNRTEATALFSAATASHYRKESTTSTNGAMSPTRESVNGDSRRPSVPTSDNGTDLQLQHRTNGELSAAGKSQADVSRAMPDPTRPSVSSERRRSSQQQPEADLEAFHPQETQQAPVVVTAARRRFFNQIITKCVLQLLMIETVSELFTNDAVYASIPSHELLRLMVLLKKSYQFAKRFNEDRELRTRLFREGFMRQPPNLLKQESGSASVYVSILLRMYNDDGEERKASHGETEKALIPLCADILASYIDLDEETQQRNIVTWRPVVVDVLEGYTAFEEKEFERNLETFAPLAVGLMGKDMGPDLQRAVQGMWAKVTEVKLGVKVPDTGRYLMTPIKAGFGRRGSRASTAGRS